MTATVLNPDAPDDEDALIAIEPTADEGEADPTGAAATGAEGSGTPAAAAKEANPSDPANGLEDLRRQLQERTASEQALREEAARESARAQQAMRFAEQANRQVASAQEQALEGQLSAAQHDLDALTAAWEKAQNEGDIASAAKINANIARAAAKLDRLESEKENPVRRQVEPQIPADPLELVLRQYTPETQAWLRKNRDVFKPDGTFKGKVLAAHEQATEEESLVSGTPEYFARVEEILGKRKPTASAEPPAAAVVRRAPAPMTAAPVSRSESSSNGRSSDPKQVRLKPHLRAAARTSGVSDAEFAAQALKLIKDGDLPADYLD